MTTDGTSYIQEEIKVIPPPEPVACLRELVATKLMKDTEGDSPAYRQRRQEAWRMARLCLKMADIGALKIIPNDIKSGKQAAAFAEAIKKAAEAFISSANGRGIGGECMDKVNITDAAERLTIAFVELVVEFLRTKSDN